MKIPTGSLVLTAAFTGLLGGTMGRLNAAPFNPNPQDAQGDTQKRRRNIPVPERIPAPVRAAAPRTAQ